MRRPELAPSVAQMASSCLAARVAMMQPAETGQGDDIGVYSSRFNVATIGGVFGEGEVTTVRVVVLSVLPNEAFKMVRAQWDHVVQQFPPKGAYPSLSDTILPGTTGRNLYGPDTHTLDRLVCLLLEYRVVVTYEILRRRLPREGLT